jgi:hypothetical protein
MLKSRLWAPLQTDPLTGPSVLTKETFHLMRTRAAAAVSLAESHRGKAKLEMRFLFVVFIAGLTLVTTAPAFAAGPEVGTSQVFSIGPGHTFIDWVPGASSTLVRATNGINASLQTSGLPAGHAVTMWALIFNNPSACSPGGCNEIAGDLRAPGVNGSVQRVTGHIVGSVGTFAGHLGIGEASQTAFGPGLLDPFGAQIHLIVRDHGLASAEIDALSDELLLLEQFHNSSPRFCNVACSDIQKSVHLPHA